MTGFLRKTLQPKIPEAPKAQAGMPEVMPDEEEVRKRRRREASKYQGSRQETILSGSGGLGKRLGG